MIFLKNNLCHSIILIFMISCSSGGSVENITNDNQSISINVNGLITPSTSYAKQTVEISTGSSMCSFDIALKDNNKKIHHVKSNDNKTFSFRNPIVYRNSESHFLVISTNLSNTCPQVSKEINLEVLKSSTKYDLIPENVDSLKTKIYAINDIGFETYQKILKDAIEELQQNKFKALYPNQKPMPKELVLDTDFEIFFPSFVHQP